MAEALRAAEADLIALQEVGPYPLADLEAALPDHTAVTVRLPLGGELRERLVPHYGPNVWTMHNEVVLFYRRAVFALAASGHWWLSPTPAEALSTGFGYRAPRLVVWARLRHQPTGQALTALATHFDLRAPLPMAEVCAQQVPALAAGGGPLLFMGDFNAAPESKPASARSSPAGATRPRSPRRPAAPTVAGASTTSSIRGRAWSRSPGSACSRPTPGAAGPITTPGWPPAAA